MSASRSSALWDLCLLQEVGSQEEMRSLQDRGSLRLHGAAGKGESGAHLGKGHASHSGRHTQTVSPCRSTSGVSRPSGRGDPDASETWVSSSVSASKQDRPAALKAASSCFFAPPVWLQNVLRHHWVHRRRQEGKCKQCGKVSPQTQERRSSVCRRSSQVSVSSEFPTEVLPQ